MHLDSRSSAVTAIANAVAAMILMLAYSQVVNGR
jgi:hypothetical protein